MQSIQDYNIKAVSSCVRFPDELGLAEARITTTNSLPASGDLVLLRCVESVGAYKSIETLSGQNVVLEPGDLFIGVLGDRFSGTNVYGVMPNTPICSGMKLQLVAIGGVVAQAVEVPGYYDNRTLSGEIVGFPIKHNGEKLNIRNAGLLRNTEIFPPVDYDCVIVCGTSAEVGKTTITCNFGKQIKSAWPEFKIGAIKICGTGRMKDLGNYKKAGYDVATDYVDFGAATTYGMPETYFTNMLENMANYVGARTNLVVMEIGGDLYEGNAPSVIKFGKKHQASFVFVVNDAMGAMDGLRVLKGDHITPVCIASYKQNMRSMAERLQQRDIFYLDMNRPSNLVDVLEQKLLPRFCHRPVSKGHGLGFQAPQVVR